ncbi:head maturation protease, ClpP-related [Nocardia sp. NPDC059228]|uniref:head maturation protease, ClpP-related n=1 Tax=Nocardia sp. NPDC059228 TaxID=3346777 RepID=UPI003680456E
MNTRMRALRRQDAAPRQWYAIHNAAASDAGPATVYLFDEIDSYWGVAAEDFVRELDAIDADEIVVKINSPGGNVFDGLAIMNALIAHPAKVTTSVEGLAASAASFIAMAGDERIMRPGAEMMIHNAWTVAIGSAADLRAAADQLDRTSANLASIYAERSGGEIAEWQAAMDAETWYSADEAVTAGLADRVEKPAKPSSAEPTASARWDLSIYAFAGRAAAPAPRIAARTRTPSAVRAEVKREEGPMPTLIEGLRERFGLPEDADEATILAAVTEQLDSAAAATEDAPAEPTAQQITASAKRLGLVLVDRTQYEQTVASASKGAAAFEQLETDQRNAVLDKHIRRGALAPGRREHFAKLLKADPEGTAELLDSLPAGSVVPLTEVGHAGEPDVDPLENEMSGVYARVTGNPWKD